MFQDVIHVGHLNLTHLVAIIVKKLKKNEIYKKVLEIFPDAELIDIEKSIEQNND